MTAYEVPLSPQPHQFWITLANVQYSLTVRWCDPMAAWVLDLADSGETALATGLPLVPGADVLAQLRYLGIGGALFMQADADPTAQPGFDGLGTASHLYFVVP